MENLHTPNEALRFICKWEGFRSKWSDDLGGVPTIGYGFTPNTPCINTERIETPLTEKRGKEILVRCVRNYYEPSVLSHIREGVHLGEHQIGAIVSLVWNVGVPAWITSTLRKKINQGKTAQAADEFLRWVYVDGEKVHGLVRRRRAEREMFLGKMRGAHRIEAKMIPTARPETLDVASKRWPRPKMKAPQS